MNRAIGSRRSERELLKAERMAPRLDRESQLSARDHLSLHLWLRLLTCSTMIERRVREQLRESFAITLPRFDLMAQLDRSPNGLKMSDISRRLMVTGGNVTGLVDQLVGEGLVVRRDSTEDRRVYEVRLTAKGKRQFDMMSAAHERVVVDLLSGLPRKEREALHESLGQLKAALVARIETGVARGR
jgi:DNA-binding MarR family transcriptional regulator